jgi:hypothetical protein
MNKTPLVIAKPSLGAFITSISGMGFFGWITWLICNPGNKHIEDSSKTAFYILSAFFAFAAIGSLIILLTVRSFELTQKTLIVKRPFLFLKHTIHLTNIETITEKPFKVESTTRGNKILIHTGSKATIMLIKGKKLTIDTFSTGNYKELIKQLKQLYRLK